MEVYYFNCLGLNGMTADRDIKLQISVCNVKLCCLQSVFKSKSNS